MSRLPQVGDVCSRCGQRLRRVSAPVADLSTTVEQRIERLDCDCFAGPLVEDT